MAEPRNLTRESSQIRSHIVTAVLILVYLAVMASTNTHFTILDDESNIIAIGGHPPMSALRLYFSGSGLHEQHPPLANLLLHFWLVATNFAFPLIRVFANLFFAAGAFFIAKAAARASAPAAYWTTLVLCLTWPFAFQYGRIAGWYGVSFFLVCLLTWSYLNILEADSAWPWLCFAIAAALLEWTNYFGLAFLLILFVDLLLFHRDVARRCIRSLLLCVAFIVLAFLPLLRIAVADLFTHPVAAVGPAPTLKSILGSAGYPTYSIFASAAVAPWFWPLSVPVLFSISLLLLCVFRSPGRRWILYFFCTLLLLDLSGQLNIKRVLFLLPWLFLAIGIATATSRRPNLARSSLAVLVLCGWLGIASGQHYTTTNLTEPWSHVASVVANDARQGATIVSVSPPFFFYLDYALGLGADTAEAAHGAYLGEALYSDHGYNILLESAKNPVSPSALSGKVVLVEGSAIVDDVQAQSVLDQSLRQRCQVLGEYHAAPDPAAVWKQRMTKAVPVMAYRTNVVWFACP